MSRFMMLTATRAILMASAKDAKGGTGGPAPDAQKVPEKAPPVSQAGTAQAPQTEIDNEGVNLQKKISPATVIGKFKKPKKLDGTNPDGSPKYVAYGEEEIWPDTPLYAVMGVTHDIKTGTGDNGPWVAFLGAFEAVRYSDGERFQGGQCFVPRAVEDMMVATLNATRRESGGGPNGAIEFAIEVGVKHSTTQMGYEYFVKNLTKTQGTDPLALLRSRVVGKLPASVAAKYPKVAALAGPSS